MRVIAIAVLIALAITTPSLAQSSRYPAIGGGGGVTSITASSPLTGGTITTSGTIGLGTVPVNKGGTGSTTASAARSVLGAAASGANTDITGLSQINFSNGVIWNDNQGTPNTATIDAPSTISASYLLSLPTAQGGAFQPLENDGTGQLVWGTATTDFATTSSVNADFSNIASKQIPSLVCATNVALSGDATCDGQDLALLTYPLVLLVAQTDSTQNGLWLPAPGTWGRAGNMPDNTFTAIGAIVTVAGGGGMTYDQTVWYINGVGDGTLHAYQMSVTQSINRPYTNAGSCVVSSTTLSTTATNETCAGIPASAAVAVSCSGEAAFSTTAAGGVYARATGTANQIAMNTAVVNTTAMAFACSWVRP